MTGPLLAMASVLGILAGAGLEGPWRGVLDVAGGPLRFTIQIQPSDQGYDGRLCNGSSCNLLSAIVVRDDSVRFEIADYAATISAVLRGDSLVGAYRNVGNRGPRTIPFRASPGTWPVTHPPTDLTGQWEATYQYDGRTSPRIFEFRDTPGGLEGTIISNTGDYGLFWGVTEADSFAMAHFDGSFVYMLTGMLDGDTLRGVFHAGLRTQTAWTAVRSRGGPYLTPPTELTTADTTAPFAFAFPDLDGRIVSNTDERFRDKVVLVDVFGTWCPTCHDAAPLLRQLYDAYHDRGLEIVGLAYEVTGDPSIDGALVRRYREKFGLEFPLLLAGINDTELAAETLPQLNGFTAFPTSIFLGRDGKVRQVHAGFYGPATGPQHTRLVADFHATIERLLAEP
ncbi:MAG: TlpA family protein disulfide reductase [Gemmatimonadales bacterium]|nr:TlpA family protein disulfide reductase [Gemmatimonadales bacterium]